jgi:hypothetical protein
MSARRRRQCLQGRCRGVGAFDVQLWRWQARPRSGEDVEEVSETFAGTLNIAVSDLRSQERGMLPLW